MKRMRGSISVLSAAVVVGFAAPASAAVQVVTKASVSYSHFTTIQDAVNAAQPGDRVLIDVGTYPEAVYVTTPNLHLRGMDENNAFGYSGTNSGGHLIIQKSTFRNNSNGVGPNSLNNDDQPPPQDGACDSGLNSSALPTFASTHIRRCTVFKHNTIENNGNFSTPANSTTAQIPWGNGLVLIGTYADLVRNNVIRNNPSSGILGFENPDPFPPTPQTVYFQLSGNAIVHNTFSGNGTPTEPSSGDITLLGGIFGTQTSVNNCALGNQLTTSTPPDIQNIWSCRLKTTPNPGSAALTYVLALMTASEARTQVGQPAPPAQPTMNAPCAGVPSNPLCP